MQAVYESHVVAYYARHRLEEVAGLHHHVDRLIGIAEQRHARLARGRFLAPLVGPGLAISLHRGDDFSRHLFEVGNLVETDDMALSG
jgi:hypothetical protein